MKLQFLLRRICPRVKFVIDQKRVLYVQQKCADPREEVRPPYVARVFVECSNTYCNAASMACIGLLLPGVLLKCIR